ncbi:MAG: iron chaperone [Actinomycetota bacterium]
MATAKKRPAARAKTATSKRASGFSAQERAAMRERAKEVRASKGGKAAADLEPEVLAKIAKMAKPDRDLATRLHAIVRSAAPELAPRLWYGMPAYAIDGKVVCFFQDAAKFKTRYSTLGFSDRAALDDGQMWPSAFALTALGPAEEKRIRALLRAAIGAR